MLGDLFTTAIIINLFSTMIRLSTPLLIAAMGELVAERSGVMNMGVEGMMLMGALVGYMVSLSTDSLWLGILFAILAGGLMALLLAFMSITLKVDQTVTGLALNLLSSGLTLFIFRAFYDKDNTVNQLFSPFPIPVLSDIPIVGDIFFNQKAPTYFAFLCIPVIAFFLYRTRTGLAIRSAGENPRAVDTRGINVNTIRYMAVIFGGMMAGLAGSFFTNGISSRFMPEITAGRGWLAIIIVIAGNWQPTRMLIATLIFALLDALQFTLQGVGTDIPFQLLLAMPYVIALIALMSSRVRSRMPGVLGVPYVKE
ncbi:MAG: ABC transporter permease [Anaerolineales bacterium]|nr:ABC transporter permease [Anaerolineales bacterium]